MRNKIEKPKVFISYAWGTDEYQGRVLSFATDLINDGIDVVLDKWDLSEGNDTYAFMEKCASDAGIGLSCDPFCDGFTDSIVDYYTNLDREEFKKLYLYYFGKGTDEEIEKMFNSIDTDGNNSIDEDEFLEYLMFANY